MDKANIDKMQKREGKFLQISEEGLLQKDKKKNNSAKILNSIVQN